MTWRTILFYSISELWDIGHRTFTVMQALCIAMCITVGILIHGFYQGFHAYYQRMDQNLQPIEIFKTERIEQDLQLEYPQLLKHPDIKNVTLWKVVELRFVDNEGNAVNYFSGQTIQPHEPFLRSINDIAGKPVNLLDAQELQQPVPECGIIVTLGFLKKLRYIREAKAKSLTEYPQYLCGLSLVTKVQSGTRHWVLLEVYDEENKKFEKVRIPVIAILNTFHNDRYLLTKELDYILNHWKKGYACMLKSRDGVPFKEPGKPWIAFQFPSFVFLQGWVYPKTMRNVIPVIFYLRSDLHLTVDFSMEPFFATLENLEKVLFTILSLFGMFFIMLGFFVLYSFYSLNMFYNLQEIGILRALGCTRTSLLQVYFVETAVITASAMILATTAGWIIGIFIDYLLNKLIYSNFPSLAQPLFIFSWHTILIACFSTVIISIIAMSIPFYQTATQSIVRIIRQRN